MFTIDLSISPVNPVYRGCELVENGGKYFIVTAKDSGVAIIQANLLKVLENRIGIPEEEVILTGMAPTWVYLLAAASATPFFSRIHYRDRRGSVEIPLPPDDFESEPT